MATPSVLEQRIHAPTPPQKWRPGLIVQRLTLVAVLTGVWWILSLYQPPFILPYQLPLATFGVIMFICTIAALMGIWKIWRVEPAIVFRG